MKIRPPCDTVTPVGIAPWKRCTTSSVPIAASTGDSTWSDPAAGPRSAGVVIVNAGEPCDQPRGVLEYGLGIEHWPDVAQAISVEPEEVVQRVPHALGGRHLPHAARGRDVDGDRDDLDCGDARAHGLEEGHDLVAALLRGLAQGSEELDVGREPDVREVTRAKRGEV